MKKIYLILMGFSLLFTGIAFSQAKSLVINGKVTSFEESLGLEGVHIYVKGAKINTATGANGRFSLAVTNEARVLVFELKNYETKEINIIDNNSFEVVLKRNNDTGVNGKTDFKDRTTQYAYNNVE